jgi:isovaleryl-CoA dehydrogenase
MRGDIGVTAMTEDSGGSDLARMRTAAFESPTGWNISGCKRHITNAPVAKLGMIAGRIPALGEKRDITLFFVELGAPGVTIGQSENNLGIRTSPTADITFENSPISDENIIGTPGDGLRLLYRVISFERALYGAIASGLIEGMIQKAMDRVESRMAFTKPLADYQYVQGRIAEMKTTSILCRLMSYAALDKVENMTDDHSIHCSTAKLLAGEGLLAAAEHLVQLHGHLGFMNNDLSRQLRDAVGMRIAGGTSDIQRINIFNQVRRQHRERNASRTPMTTPKLEAELFLANV